MILLNINNNTMTIDDQFSDSPELISQLSPEEQKIANVIEDLLQPCDKKT
ncbi:hypothetical protein [Cyanobacterium sp. Dongsha4]|nr:hypothetical protein [Cyanobacterium sp. Dongsha4]WVL01850.1 hypothetical protein Dongsha4_06590 [Cyanobacterium sp. Dongsha4]